jgi:hypothetical protein
MARKPDLRQAIVNANARLPETPPRKADPQTVESTRRENPHFRPSREGKSNITGYYPKAVKKQIRSIAAEMETTIEGCLAEALNDFFAKYGKPELAPRKPRR